MAISIILALCVLGILFLLLKEHYLIYYIFLIGVFGLLSLCSIAISSGIIFVMLAITINKYWR